MLPQVILRDLAYPKNKVHQLFIKTNSQGNCKLNFQLRFPEAPFPDILHSYFSVCGLCLSGLLPPLDAMLGMSQSSRRRAEARGLLPTTSMAAMGPATEAVGNDWGRTWLALGSLGVVLISAGIGMYFQ